MFSVSIEIVEAALESSRALISKSWRLVNIILWRTIQVDAPLKVQTLKYYEYAKGQHYESFSSNL